MRVALAFRHVEALGIELEVVDQRFHRILHFATTWWRQFGIARQDGPGAFLRQQLNALLDDLGGLFHFLHAANIAVVIVAVLADRDFEFEFVIAFIGLRATQVPGQAASAHHDARKAPFHDRLHVHDADINVALLEDAVLGDE